MHALVQATLQGGHPETPRTRGDSSSRTGSHRMLCIWFKIRPSAIEHRRRRAKRESCSNAKDAVYSVGIATHACIWCATVGTCGCSAGTCALHKGKQLGDWHANRSSSIAGRIRGASGTAYAILFGTEKAGTSYSIIPQKCSHPLAAVTTVGSLYWLILDKNAEGCRIGQDQVAMASSRS